MAEIEIPSDLLQDLKASSPAGDGESGDGVDQATEQAMERLTKVLAWGFGSVHKICVENDLSGFGRMKPEEVAELTGIVIEKHAGSAFVKNSPEIMLGTIFSGVLVNNVLDLQRKRKAQANESEPETEKNSTE